MNKLFGWLNFSTPIRSFSQALGYSRFSALVLVGALLVFLFPGQGQELLASTDENSLHFLYMLIAVFFAAANAWYWSRTVLSREFARAPGAGVVRIDYAKRNAGAHSMSELLSAWRLQNFSSVPRNIFDGSLVHPWLAFFINQMPRVLALGVFAIAAYGYYTYGKNADGNAGLVNIVVILVLGVAFYLFLSARKKIMNRITGSVPMATDSRAHVWGILLTAIFIVLPFAFLFLPVIDRVEPGIWISQHFGAGAIVFFALGLLIPVGSFLVVLTHDEGFPIIWSLLLIAALISSLPNLNFDWAKRLESHEMRTVSSPLIDRPTLEQEFLTWYDQAQRNWESDEPVPMVIVASAGGGLPAAHWTVTILGSLQDVTEGMFSDHLFAISSVSGGSLGAAVFASEVAARDRYPYADNDPCSMSVECYARRSLTYDFLAPNVFALLFYDVYQHVNYFIPIAKATGFVQTPDRGEYLERAWEIGWQKSHHGDDVFLKSFLQYRNGLTAWQPTLLLNATHQETGRRAIASHIDISDTDVLDAIDLLDASDANKNSGDLQNWCNVRDLPLSTAAHNSARFPYVSPAGKIPATTCDDCEGTDCQLLTGHLIDGAYFENNGAATALDLLEALSRIANDANIEVTPIVIQIVSDPSETDWLGETQRPELKPAFGILNEIFAPVRGIFATRSSRGAVASLRLRSWVEKCAGSNNPDPGYEEQCSSKFKNAEYHVFQMTKGASKEGPGLGWSLSTKSTLDICKMASGSQAGLVSGLSENTLFIQDKNESSFRDIAGKIGSGESFGREICEAKFLSFP